MYTFGQPLSKDVHFHDHIEHHIPVQVYSHGNHTDIGFVIGISKEYVRINNLYYNRKQFTFVSRPGY